jgi:hypothetical protein
MHLTELLEYAFLSGGFTTRSDFARDNAELVGIAAQNQLITTLTPRDGYCKVWRVTVNGYQKLWQDTAAERSLEWQTLDS